MTSFLLDLEGTLVKDKTYTPFEEGLEFTRFLDEKGIKWIIASNNSTEKPRELVKTLREKGFNVNENKILTPSLIASNVLKREGVKRIFFIGTSKIREFFEEEGFEVRNDHKVDAVVVGRDKEINYQKLKIATSALVLNDAKLFAFHTNKLILDPDGFVGPSVGAIAKALSYASDKEITSFGKPSVEYFKRAFEILGEVSPEEVFMVSDDPFSDLAGGKEITGFKTVFVLCGKYKDPKVLDKLPENLKPDFVFRHVGECKKLVR